MDILKSMGVMIGQPWLALIPAAFFLLCAALVRSRGAVYVAALWAVYCLYELAMKYRLMCSGECNIRIDLLALYPFLIVASLAGLVMVGLAAARRIKA